MGCVFSRSDNDVFDVIRYLVIQKSYKEREEITEKLKQLCINRPDLLNELGSSDLNTIVGKTKIR